MPAPAFRTIALAITLAGLSALTYAADARTDATDSLITWRDNLEITRQDFEIEMEKLDPKFRDDFRRNLSRITRRLEDMLVVRTLAAEAEAMKLDQHPEIQARIRLAVDEVLEGAMLAHIRNTTAIPDLTAQAEDHYKLNKKDFAVPEEVHVAHILIAAKNRSEDEALALATELRAKLAAGAQLKDLATQSDDPSARRNGGDLGAIGRGRTVKEFEDAAFALKTPGEISPVVKTKFGYHVIQLIDRQEARQKPFAEVKDAIIKTLTAQLRATATREYMAKLRNDPSIKLNKPAIDALVTPSSEAPQ